MGWAITFFIIALIAAFFGFGGVAALSADIGQLLIGLFLILLIAGIVIAGVRRASRGQVP